MSQLSSSVEEVVIVVFIVLALIITLVIPLILTLFIITAIVISALVPLATLVAFLEVVDHFNVSIGQSIEQQVGSQILIFIAGQVSLSRLHLTEPKSSQLNY